MNGIATDIQPWSRLRWGFSLAAVIALHFTLVLALGRAPTPKIKSQPTTTLILPETLAHEFQSLTDPTLLAMGGPHGFSSIWMEPTTPPPLNPNREQPPRWLEIDSASWGGDFVVFARSNAASLHGLRFKSAPQVLASASTEQPPPAIRPSTLRIVGDLAGRTLLHRPDLPPQQGVDLLIPSEVRLVVDSRGIVTSAILLPPGSGSKEADRLAVAVAKAIRFVPASTSGADQPLTFGGLIFDWQTVPPDNASPPANE
jgi:hypothetical protein